MRPSLARRLISLYLVTILLVVGIAGGLVWFMMRRALYRGLDETLRTEAQALAGRLEADHDRIEFEQANLPPGGDLHVRIVDLHGDVLFASPTWENHQPLIDRVAAATPGESPIWLTAPIASDDAPYRVLALHVLAHPDDESADQDTGAVGAWVWVARPLAPLTDTLGQLASILGLAVGVTALVALGGGYIVARRGTRPVRALAESVGRVNPANPALILTNGPVPVELEPIVRTTEGLLERVRGELVRQRQLTADVAHDLRTPVAGVRTLLDVCLQRERDSAEYIAVIEKARGALRQLSQLLEDVLTLSRLEAGVDRPAWADTSLDAIVSSAVATVQPLAAARGVSIQATPSDQSPVRTDRGKLVKVLSNLLSNAIEHSPRGEIVVLDARIEDGALELAITDHGPGVPPNLRACIFDRFVRGDPARAGADGHQGLGLPIAAGLARTLGGTVTLDERDEPGSRFVVRLPVARPGGE